MKLLGFRMAEEMNIKKVELPSLKLKAKRVRKSKIKTAGPDEVFEEWSEEWKKVNMKYTNVTLSLHSSSKEKKSNFLMLSQNGVKNHHKSKVIIHFKMIDEVINSMQDFKKQLSIINDNPTLSTKKEDEFVVDEWDINSNQSLFRRELAAVYADLMLNLYHTLSNQFCEGCIHDYPSQKDHDCLMMSMNDRISLLFDVLFDNVNESEANFICSEKLKGKISENANLVVSKDVLRNDVEWLGKLKEILNEKSSEQF